MMKVVENKKDEWYNKCKGLLATNAAKTKTAENN